MPVILVHIVYKRSVYLGFVGRQKPLDAVIIAFILFTVLITRAIGVTVYCSVLCYSANYFVAAILLFW